jgi:hypothetical protein
MQMTATPDVYRTPALRPFTAWHPTNKSELYGGLDPALHHEVQLEMQLLMAPILPFVACFVLLTAWTAVGNLAVFIGASDLIVDLGVSAEPYARAACWLWGLWRGGAWVVAWARAQRRPIVALAFAPLFVIPLLFGGAVGVLALLAARFAYPAIRSRLSPTYCLARLVAYERSERNLVGDAFNFDTRVLGKLGWLLVLDLWLMRWYTRPFIRAARPVSPAPSGILH